jgi:peptidyl-prolyl cis-trans isomerase C
MQLRHILLKTPLLVEPVMQSLNQGADFAQMARDHSACPSKTNGGSLAQISGLSLPESFKQALEDTEVGQVIGPVESRHGLHLIKIESLA